MDYTWRQAGQVLKSNDELDDSLLKRLSDPEYSKPFRESEKVKRDLIKFYIYYNKAAARLYDDTMNNKITNVIRLIPYDITGRLQLSTMVGTYMAGRPAEVHPDDETITKLSYMYDRIMTEHSGKVDYGTVKESSDNYDHRQQQQQQQEQQEQQPPQQQQQQQQQEQQQQQQQQQEQQQQQLRGKRSRGGDGDDDRRDRRRGGGSSNRKKKHPRSTNKQKLLAKRVRRRSMKNKKKGKWYKK
jgi:hypothetical protein